jgi:hypothetical protein
MELTTLTVSELVHEVVNRSGGDTITEPQVLELIEEGAPVNDDGTIHLVRFAAWLLSKKEKG